MSPKNGRNWSVAARLTALVVATVAALNACSTTAPRADAPARIVGPYKDLSIAFDEASGLWSSQVGGKLRPVVEVVRPGTTISLAFADGECGSERIGGRDPAVAAPPNVAAFVRAGIDYIVSTGGAVGVFTCGRDAGMQAFIDHYDSPRLRGLDFDIEGTQDAAVVEALVRRLVVVQQRRPSLRLSFTLATPAASDGSRASLNAQGQQVLAAIRSNGLRDYTINLMVMDFGAAVAANCVVRDGVCDMAASARQAAENLHSVHGVPYAQIALTAMVGVNDVAQNDTRPVDIEAIARFYGDKGLAGLHFWALDRDQPCERPPMGASPLCSGMPQVSAGEFSRAAGWPLR